MEPNPDPFELVLITGVSGSGKSTVARALEDLGFHVVDNLPLVLLESVLHQPEAVFPERKRAAVVADVRVPGFDRLGPALLDSVDRARVFLQVIFVDASNEVLLRRYSESRRPHPLARDGDLARGIASERERLAEIRARSSLVLDTSVGSVHDLREAVFARLGAQPDRTYRLALTLESFGFKYGPPAGADLMLDVRFLPNPYFRPELRDLPGTAPEVETFLHEQTEFRDFLGRILTLLDYLLPRYVRECRHYLTLAIGCTGGRHRSVAVVEALQRELRSRGWSPAIRHRDLERDK